MSIAEKLQTIAENEQRVYDAGKQAEYDEFWDAYQDYGNRGEYAYAFGGIGWTKTDMFPPKYPIKLNDLIVGNIGIFRDFNKRATTRYDMTTICATMDCSKAVRLNGMFADACVENITIDMSNCQIAIEMFSCANGGGNIDKIYLKVTEKLTNATGMFSYCNNLETISFAENSVIAVNLDFTHSPLSEGSIRNVINTLSSTATSKTLTLKKTAVQNAFGSDYDSSTEWTTLKNSKSNWTISLK